MMDLEPSDVAVHGDVSCGPGMLRHYADVANDVYASAALVERVTMLGARSNIGTIMIARLHVMANRTRLAYDVYGLSDRTGYHALHHEGVPCLPLDCPTCRRPWPERTMANDPR